MYYLYYCVNLHIEPFYDINKLKEIPIGDIADKLGIDTVKRGNKLWCNLRGEKTASCCINIDKNYFYDFGGQPEGGDGIKFVSKAEGISAKDSIYRLADMFAIDLKFNMFKNALLSSLASSFIVFAHDFSNSITSAKLCLSKLISTFNIALLGSIPISL